MEANYADYFDATALRRTYLVGDAFLAKYATINRDFIWQAQNEAFKRLLARAWRMQFYRGLWGAHGVKPGDIRSLLDIHKLPVFDAQALIATPSNAFESIGIGDLLGLDSYGPGSAPPVVGHFFSPRGLEIAHLLYARAELFQGQPADDIAQFLSSNQYDRDAIIARRQSNSNHARYGTETAGLIAVEGLDRDGLYLMEDAQYVELLAPNAQPVAECAPGEVVLTTLYKADICPLIRFNTHDIAADCMGESSLGLNLRRIQLYPRQ